MDKVAADEAIKMWDRHLREANPLRLCDAMATHDDEPIRVDVRAMSGAAELLNLLWLRVPTTADRLSILAGRQVYRAMGRAFGAEYAQHLVERAARPLRLAPVDRDSSPWRIGDYDVGDAGAWRRHDPDGILGSNGIVDDFEAWVVRPEFWTTNEPRILLRLVNERFEVPTLAAA